MGAVGLKFVLQIWTTAVDFVNARVGARIDHPHAATASVHAMSLKNDNVVDQNRSVCFPVQPGPPKLDIASGPAGLPRLLKLRTISAKLAGALRKPLIRFQLPLVVIVGLDVSQDQRHLCPCDLTWKENDEEACRRDECEENGFHKLWQTN